MALTINHQTNNISATSGNATIDGTVPQPLLVSGTNIKTVNGTSLLGSGDLITAAGLRVLGTLASTANLPGSGSLGDGYVISGELHVWNGTVWVNAGTFAARGRFDSTSVISTNTNAVSGVLYMITSPLTLTLPASPGSTAFVGVTNIGGGTTSIVARNGSNIMNLAEDLTIDVVNGGFILQYSGNSTIGWVIV